MHDRKIRAAERKAAVKAQLAAQAEPIMACRGGDRQMQDNDERTLCVTP